jgi:hypothetical protein
LRLAATYGHDWVTIGPTGPVSRTPETTLAAVQKQLPLLEEACRSIGREPESIGKVLLWTPTEPTITSLNQFDELSTPYADLGFDQFVLHHPAQTGPYAGDIATFEQIAARAAND